jgi:hypothetical protein
MTDAPSDIVPTYIAYIDEGGDPGLNKVAPGDAAGASEWMSLGAAVFLSQHDRHIPDLVRGIKAAIRSTQPVELHFRNLSDDRKMVVCSVLAERNLRGFVVCSHKPNMKGHQNEAAAMVGPRGWFYNWCIRLLLERITDFVERESIATFGSPKYVKLVFAERGRTQYFWLHDYIDRLKRQSKASNLYLTKRDIKHSVLHPSLIEVVPSIGSAGCQIADSITSAFHCAADADGNRWNINPAIALKPIMPTEGGFCFDYSVALQPSFFKTTRLSDDQKLIFEHYGYDFRTIEKVGAAGPGLR